MLSKLERTIRIRKLLSIPGSLIGAHSSKLNICFSRPLHAQSEDAIVGKQEEQKPAPLNYLEPNIPAADFNVDFSAIVGSEWGEIYPGFLLVDKLTFTRFPGILQKRSELRSESQICQSLTKKMRNYVGNLKLSVPSWRLLSAGANSLET